MHAHEQKFHIAMCCLPSSQRIMSMNLEMLEPASGVFYVQGTANEHVPTVSLPQRSRPKEDSAREMGNVRWSSGQCGYSWEWPDHLYWSATQSGVDDGPTMVAVWVAATIGVGSCNHQHPCDEISGVEETVVVC